MLESYVASVGRCKTINDINRLHLDLEVGLLPRELGDLVARVRTEVATLPTPCARWIARMELLLGLSDLPPQDYASEKLGDALSLLAVAAPPETRRMRTLVIGYTGNARRFLLPLPVFLRYCDGERYEFLMLVDRSRHSYLRGVDGVAGDLPGMIVRVGDVIATRRYRRVVSFGTSSGGLAALWTAVALGLERGISIAGAGPDHIGERGEDRVDVEALRSAVAARPGRVPELLYAFGALNERDRMKGLAHARYLPVTPIELPGIASHGGFLDLLKRRELRAFLERVLG